MTDRRRLLQALGLAPLVLATPPVAAASLSDWFGDAGIIAGFVAAGIPVRSYNIPTSSMTPTLVVGDVILADLRNAGKLPRQMVGHRSSIRSWN